MIVKNEEKALPACLASLSRAVDEVVVYDTGSTDRTVELARAAGARVVIGYWDDDFGRARNACLEACRGEWVLWIDADERFECLGVPALRQALAQRRDLDGMLTTIYNRTGDGTGPGSLHQAIRVFRKANCRWYGKLHEQVDARPGLGRGLNVARLDGTQIDHYGYLDEVVKERDKLARNLHMARDELANGTVAPGQEGVPELNVGRALAALERYAEAQPYLDQALEVAHEGPPERAALLFRAQNLLSLGRCDEAAATARRFREVCQKKGLALYLEGAALRRSGHPHEAVALLEEVGEAANEDGFSFAANLLLVELAGALIEAGRTGEATDHLVRLVSISPSPGYVAAAMQAFAASDRAVRDLALAMPEQHLDKVAAALLIVPPVIAEPLADALFCRFGQARATGGRDQVRAHGRHGQGTRMVGPVAWHRHGGIVPLTGPGPHGRAGRPRARPGRRDCLRRLRGHPGRAARGGPGPGRPPVRPRHGPGQRGGAVPTAARGFCTVGLRTGRGRRRAGGHLRGAGPHRGRCPQRPGLPRPRRANGERRDRPRSGPRPSTSTGGGRRRSLITSQQWAHKRGAHGRAPSDPMEEQWVSTS